MEKKPAPTKTVKEEAVAPPPQTAAAQPMFSKKLLLIGGGVIAAIVAIVVAMLLLAGPTKTDYNDALTTMKTVRDNYKEIDRGMRRVNSGLLLSNTESEPVSVEKELKTYQDSVAKLKDMKALRDKEVKEAYDKFVQKNEKFAPYIEEMGKSLGDYTSMNKTCNALSSVFRGLNASMAKQSGAEFDEKMAPCKKAIEKLKDSKNETVAKLGSKLSESFDAARKAAFKVAESDASDPLKSLEARTDMLRAVRTVSEAMREFSNKLREDVKTYDVADEINTLGRLLTKKYNEAK